MLGDFEIWKSRVLPRVAAVYNHLLIALPILLAFQPHAGGFPLLKVPHL
jgi:hypothetical protein